jgi:hypothetical protein
MRGAGEAHTEFIGFLMDCLGFTLRRSRLLFIVSTTS